MLFPLYYNQYMEFHERMISAANELACLCSALSQALQSFKKVVLFK